MLDHVQDHRRLGPLRALDESNPAIHLLPCAEDYHAEQILDPRTQVVGAVMPVMEDTRKVS